MNRQHFLRSAIALIFFLILVSSFPATAREEAPPNDVYLPMVRHVVQSVRNGNFDQGNAFWTEYSNHGWQIILNDDFPGTVKARSGTWAAWLGGDYDDISYIQQQVTVTPNDKYLVYWHWIASEESGCGLDTLTVSLGGSIISNYPLCSSANTNGWQKWTIGLNISAVQTLTLRLEVVTDSTLNSNLFIDDVSMVEFASLGDPLVTLDNGVPDDVRQPLEAAPKSER